ncbi:MAG: Tim44/TimA family putative adaptor protein [Alphaproteobacteria bacterium]
MNYFDIVFFAIVAVVLILRLRAVLGRRNEDEPQRPNPFGIPPSGREDDDADFVVSPKTADPEINNQPRSLPPPILAPESLAGSLEQLHRLDPGFDEKLFLKNARAAFAMIVAAFAKGDLVSLKNLLGPEVYATFAKAVEKRQAAGQRLETTIVAIKDAEVQRAKMVGDIAHLTVRFVSHQANATYDQANQLVDGNPHGREEIEDVWTFARNVTQRDPSWHLVETGA